MAHAIHSGGFYGAERVVLDLLTRQSRSREVAPILLSYVDRPGIRDELASRVEDGGGKVIRFETGRGFGPVDFLRYARLLGRHGVDLVHSHGYKANFFHLMSRKLRLHRVPLVITAHGYPRASRRLRSKIYHALDLRLSRSAEAIVAVSKETADFIVSRNPGCRPHVVENGIDPGLAAGAGNPLAGVFPDRGRDEPVIGCIGRLIHLKNHRLLIEACSAVMARLPCRLVIIGEGPLRAELEERMAASIPAGRGALIPFQANIYDWMAGMDIVALPSLMEGLPMTLLEAGALGKATVCSRVGGIPDVVRHGGNGLLVEPGDGPGLEAALADLAADAARRAELGENLRRTVAERFDAGKTHGRYLEVYREALGIRGNRG